MWGVDKDRARWISEGQSFALLCFGDYMGMEDANSSSLKWEFELENPIAVPESCLRIPNPWCLASESCVSISWTLAGEQFLNDELSPGRNYPSGVVRL